MIVFLCGPDDFRRREKREFVIGEFRKKHPEGALMILEGEDANLEKLQDFLRQKTLFGGKKLAVIPDLEFYPDMQKIWKEAAQNKDTTLLIESRKIPAKSSTFSKTPVTREEFPVLTGKEWRDFLAKEVVRVGAKISKAALALLAQVFRGDSWGVATELQKLSCLNREIGAEDLARLGLDAAPEYWPMLNGLKSWLSKERLKALALLQAENEPPAKTFNILASTSEEKALQFAEFDAQIKSGKLEYEEALLSAAL